MWMALALWSGGLFAQEICDNGIDDDGNGLIDLNDTAACACHWAGVRTSGPAYLPNPSFEERSCCPSGFAQMGCLDGWVPATSGTTDYIHTCGFAPGITPVPFPDGDGCIALIADHDWKEYIGTCLDAPLRADSTYSLGWSVSGFTANDGLAIWNPEPSFGALDLTLFGTADCTDLPAPTLGCPGAMPGWVELGTVHYQPDTAWTHVELTFTSPMDITAIALGPPCTLPADYPTVDPPSLNNAWFFFDGLALRNANSIDGRGSLCADDLVLEAFPEADATQFQWYRNGVALPGETSTVLPVSDLGLGAGDYQFRSSSGDTCIVLQHPVGPEGPNATFIADPTEGEAPLLVHFVNTTAPSPGQTIQWVLDGTVITDAPSPSFTYAIDGEYEVYLIVSDASGCSDTAWTRIIVGASGIPTMPNVFTPDDDGVNDRFRSLTAVREGFRLTVRNRWGQVVFTTADLRQGWDGRIHGDPAPDGTYFWTLASNEAPEGPITGSGHVTLLRARH